MGQRARQVIEPQRALMPDSGHANLCQAHTVPAVWASTLSHCHGGSWCCAPSAHHRPSNITSLLQIAQEKYGKSFEVRVPLWRWPSLTESCVRAASGSIQPISTIHATGFSFTSFDTATHCWWPYKLLRCTGKSGPEPAGSSIGCITASLSLCLAHNRGGSRQLQ